MSPLSEDVQGELNSATGGFYAPHTDGTRDSHATIQHRRVSVVVFLNTESDQPAKDCYGGGKLTFHGILNEAQWANCAFSLDPHPGLLVAFRSDLLHEVKRVTFGQRFTIVSWFLAGARDDIENWHGNSVSDFSRV